MPPTPNKTPNALLHGALDALILKTLARGPSHGYAVARYIEETTCDAFPIEDGSLYPALYRLEAGGFIKSEWEKISAGPGPRRRIYRLTRKGKHDLAKGRQQWASFVRVIGAIVGAPA